MRWEILVLGIIAMLIVAPLISSAVAKPKKGDGPKPGTDFNGPHYNLNILGKKHIGNGTYDNPDRHTIFVPLEGDTTLQMELGSGFAVLDGNGLDGECSFQMPRKQKNFKVYIVALGKPGDGTDVNYTYGWVFDNATNNWYWELNDSFFIPPHKGKPKWINVTGAFQVNLTYYNETTNETGTLYNGWLWQVPEELWEESLYFWDFKGSDRHIQVRFYPY
ncbi:unnamed protein product [marine sediment metagenome]|uniref:Uncharacterized protein n=1 Tax=marine sediment metagenome TaxID=412755 RepID=X1A2E2_9ZZZZ